MEYLYVVFKGWGSHHSLIYSHDSLLISPITCSAEVSSGHRERIPSPTLSFRFEWFSKSPRFLFYSPQMFSSKNFCEWDPFPSLYSEKFQGVWKSLKLYLFLGKRSLMLNWLSELLSDLNTWRLHAQWFKIWSICLSVVITTEDKEVCIDYLIKQFYFIGLYTQYC